MMHEGGCRCGELRYRIEGEPVHHAVCHCRDCQLAHAAPMVAWLAVSSDKFALTHGSPSSFESDSGSVRHFCKQCGTPLHFVNEAMLPGLVDIPSATLDTPAAFAPSVQIQTAERREWVCLLSEMPKFERYPG